MKHLNTYITEYIIKKKLDKPIDSEYQYHPNSKEELTKNIQELISNKIYDFNCIDTSEITDMSNLFGDIVNNINKINFDVSKWDVSNVESMLGLFFNCKKFDCDLSNWDVSNVNKTSYMFYDCRNFDCNLSKWDVSNVKDMTCMFGNCVKFKGKGLENWNVSKAEYMIRMFIGCDNFTGEQIENWKIKKDCSKFEMLSNCKNIKNMPSWYEE